MPGLAIVDELYFAHPSIRLGGWLAFELKRSELPYLNLVPGESDLAPVPVHELKSLSDVVATLENHEKDFPPGTFFYRGQVARRQVACPAHIPRLGRAFPNLAKPTFKYESFLPSAYRRFLDTRSGGKTAIIRWPAWKPESLLNSVAPVVRALMQSRDDQLRYYVRQYFTDVTNHPEIVTTRFLALRGAGSNPLPLDIAAAGTNVPSSLLTLISWAQHYEFGSIMVDISSSVKVAAWFASHSWTGEPANGEGGNGVVYRFDYREIRHFIEKELHHETPMAPLIRALGFLGLADISLLPPSVGRRPAAQRGASLLGLENFVFAYLMTVYPALEIFTFPLQSVTNQETDLAKDDLCPRDDPALKLFRDPGLSQTPVSPEEIAAFLEAEGFGSNDRGFLVRSFQDGLL